jgi:hypothetical protein
VDTFVINRTFFVISEILGEGCSSKLKTKNVILCVLPGQGYDTIQKVVIDEYEGMVE